MYGPRVALWAVGVASFVWLVSPLLTDWAIGLPPIWVICLLFALVVLSPATAELLARRHKERQERAWYAENFASFEEFRGSVDCAAVLRIRETRGVGRALLEVRRQYPSVPLKVAARLVREL
ncbi:hypothetical protein [Streptomyces sp. S465]|uniref:hypothetical protein n=1 Tax=Streptomyces sp. S465 TaxID=2979468 RepID=UPI0022A89B0E|nr:hypothetical protein [Streptomyces sp. S465]WAP58649.1 hypothetical protein N6H00_28865 [Streptomyces sp. S465]